jgi:hypothetical protein
MSTLPTYTVTGTVMKGIYRTLYFLSTHNCVEKVQPWNGMQQLLHSVAIRGTVCNITYRLVVTYRASSKHSSILRRIWLFLCTLFRFSLSALYHVSVTNISDFQIFRSEHHTP